MKIVPLISLRNGRILNGKKGEHLSLESLFLNVENDSLLYVLDYDGIEHNKPNLDLYQRLTERCVLWIDNGPRRIDDVMDTIMSGATNLTLRQEIWPLSLDMSSVQELTDDEIFLELSSQQNEKKTLHHPFSTDIGIVLLNEDQKSSNISPDIATHYKLYLYVPSHDTISLWEQQGITGIIRDLNKKEVDS